MLRAVIVLIGLSLSLLQTHAVAEESLQKILFGSCIKEGFPMPILSQMASEQADVMIFLGDNIYADTEDMQVMRKKYQLLADNKDFQKLLKSAPAYAVWDDHDYGVNDGGTNYPQKVLSQVEFLDFWNVSKDSPRRSRAGTYDSIILGPKGKRVQLLLLDTRYFRSPLKKGNARRTGGPYAPDDDASKTMLGEEQWKWLKAELLKPAEIRIVASSIQCLASDAGQETWSNLPAERERLFKLIRETKANGLFIISGDRHWSEYSMTEEALSYPLYEFTSSSFNQVHPRGTPTENDFRVSETTYHLQNYGVILIDWSQPEIELKIQIRDLDGESRLEKRLKLSALSQ
ncbi:alkaline phosphatase family protein [Planctomicrobium sp.]|jgi:alkaline phosphatase D|nr:alkaline phosphatase D family protein [Planctomicrobium sp.]MBT5017516.1 alkaline phosphatase family protein [Planctomicrobium sp.]MDA7504099.1 alkaline phosphatase family protein [bacterium]MDB4743015.1 alkaline phosphatase family protein [Planctomicrobium sp.]